MFLAFFELVDTEFTDGNIFAVILSDSNDKFQLINSEFPVEIYYKKKMMQIQALA